MRAVTLFIALFALAAAEEYKSHEELVGDCLIDSAQAISDAMDASMYVWAAVERCGKAGEEAKCSIGIMSATESTIAMVNVVLSAIHKCGQFERDDYACGITASRLTKNAAGLGSASALVHQHCETITAVGQTVVAGHTNPTNYVQSDPAQCVVDMKDAAHDLFKGIHSLLEITDQCTTGNTGSNRCIEHYLGVVGSLSGFGGYLAGTVGHCSPPNTNAGSVCAQASLELTQRLTDISKDALKMSENCGQAASRLYSQINVGKKKYKSVSEQAGLSPNMLIAASLPVAALVSFAGGRWFATWRHQAQITVETASDVE